MQATQPTRRAFLAGTLATGAALTIPTTASAAAPVALFVAAHPDDETLSMGVTIAEHVAAGVDTHVLLLTRGQASSARAAINGDYVSSWWRVRHTPAAEGYAALSADQFGAARIGEAHRALACLGAVTVHEANLPDGGLTQWSAIDAIRGVADLIAPTGRVYLKTHSAKVENHPDHIAAGNAVGWLARYGDPARFPSPRYYILPAYWADPRLVNVTEWWDQPTNTGIRDRAINACRAYSAWAPPTSYAVGYHSTATLFTKVAAAPKCLTHA
jgi:LmbE family N-acetylglucosaminyl deacetylase